MANFKRRKPRREVRCPLCTPNRYGNSAKSKDGVVDVPRRVAVAEGLIELDDAEPRAYEDDYYYGSYDYSQTDTEREIESARLAYYGSIPV